MSLGEIIKVDGKKFKRNAYMFSKFEIILHSHNIILIMRIIVF